MQSRVRMQFKLPELRRGVNWYDVDGARDMDVISAEIREAVKCVQVQEKENGTRTIKALWTLP